MLSFQCVLLLCLQVYCAVLLHYKHDILGPATLLSYQNNYTKHLIISASAQCYAVAKDGIGVVDSEIPLWRLIKKPIKAIKSNINWLLYGRRLSRLKKPETIPTLFTPVSSYQMHGCSYFTCPTERS